MAHARALYLLTALAAAAAASAQAQTQTLTTAPTYGGAVRLSDGVFVYPTVNLAVGRNSNVTGVPAAQAISSSVLSLQPLVVAETQRGPQRYTLQYRGDYTRYASSKADNVEDHTLEAAGDYALTTRARMGWALTVQDKNDPRDSTSAEPVPDNWRGVGARALFEYGAEGAAGRLQAEYALGTKRYQNNQAFGSTNADLDRALLAGRFFWRVMPKTRALVEARLADIDYRVDNSNDNTDTRLLLGLTWDATAKTTGTVKVGNQRKNYSSTRPDFSGNTVEASIDWSPLPYSTVTLSADRSADDSNDVGVSYLRNTSTGVAWTHEWTDRVATRVSYADTKRVYVNSPNGRTDKAQVASVGVLYQVGRNYQLAFDLANTRNNSSVNSNDFKRNTFFVTLQAQL